MADIFDQMLSRYTITTKDDELNAKHEVMQQVTLAGLYRAEFFEKAAFYGGTCLRIFHDLKRFSEDMDFSLLEKETNFSIENYFDAIEQEFKSLGRSVEIYQKRKTINSNIESAFLKDNTEIYNIKFQTEPAVKIKLEVDTDPPLFFQTESKLLLLPFSFMTKCYTLPSLFAGKMHALLFRKWNSRVKGRDWFDFEWYVRNNIPMDFNHFLERAAQSQGISKQEFDESVFKKHLQGKIKSTNINLVKADVKPFIKNQDGLSIWSNDYFSQLAEMIQFK